MTITFPIDPAESTLDDHSQDELLSTRATVLIVDDDPTARLALAAMLGPEDYHIVFAADAGEVRGRLSRIDPDVIVCDLVMAEMCGDEFLRWLQAHERWHLVPAIAVTRIDNPVVRADLLLAGADSVIVKPCNPAELRAQVRAALRTRRKYERITVRDALATDAPRRASGPG